MLRLGSAGSGASIRFLDGFEDVLNAGVLLALTPFKLVQAAGQW